MKKTTHLKTVGIGQQQAGKVQGVMVRNSWKKILQLIKLISNK